jgi:hypothetical protein
MTDLSEFKDFAVFDVKTWPIVTVTLEGEPQDSEEFEDYLSGFDLLYEKKRNFSLLIDATNIGTVQPFYVIRQAFHMHQKETETKKYVKKVALIITNDFAVKLLNTLFAMRKPVCKTEIFKNTREAKEWLNKN